VRRGGYGIALLGRYVVVEPARFLGRAAPRAQREHPEYAHLRTQREAQHIARTQGMVCLNECAAG
jgi:hypothetical protein